MYAVQTSTNVRYNTRSELYMMESITGSYTKWEALMGTHKYAPQVIFTEGFKRLQRGHLTWICKGSQCVLSSVLAKVIYYAVFYV